MPTYFFLFGNHPQLSRAELQAIIDQPVAVGTAWADGYELSEEQARSVLERSAGIIKVSEMLNSQSHLSTSEVEDWIIDNLLSTDAKKPQFSVTAFGRDHLEGIELSRIKSALVSAGKKARFRESGEYGVSAAVGLNEKMHEFLVFHTDEKTIISKTIAVQDIDLWTLLDRGKPYADRKKGMLPPKLARIMVNLGLGTKDPQGEVIYDPFCGTGTVLMEAAMVGVSGYGSDLDTEAVQGAKENIAWQQKELGVSAEYTIFQSDVSKAGADRFETPPTLIVTEPFLGRPKPKATFIPRMMKGLEKLYLGAFKQWARILADQAEVVIVFPVVDIEGKRFSLEKLIDKLAQIGYTTDLEPLEYGRPGAIVRRQIWRFTFQRKGT